MAEKASLRKIIWGIIIFKWSIVTAIWENLHLVIVANLKQNVGRKIRWAKLTVFLLKIWMGYMNLRIKIIKKLRLIQRSINVCLVIRKKRNKMTDLSI